MAKGEHTYVRTLRTYLGMGQTLYPLHSFVVLGDKQRDNMSRTKQKGDLYACAKGKKPNQSANTWISTV